MKRILAGAALTLLLSGCSSTPQGGTSHQESISVRSNAHYVQLPEGRRVLCVFEQDAINGGGGTSCDWEHAK